MKWRSKRSNNRRCCYWYLYYEISSFPDYIKIWYVDEVYVRLKQLNDKSVVTFDFILYAYYKVNYRLEDKTVHDIIDKLNPSLRSKDNINGLENNLVFVEPTVKEMEDEAILKESLLNFPRWIG